MAKDLSSMRWEEMAVYASQYRHKFHMDLYFSTSIIMDTFAPSFIYRVTIEFQAFQKRPYSL